MSPGYGTCITGFEASQAELPLLGLFSALCKETVKGQGVSAEVVKEVLVVSVESGKYEGEGDSAVRGADALDDGCDQLRGQTDPRSAGGVRCGVGIVEEAGVEQGFDGLEGSEG